MHGHLRHVLLGAVHSEDGRFGRRAALWSLVAEVYQRSHGGGIERRGELDADAPADGLRGTGHAGPLSAGIGAPAAA